MRSRRRSRRTFWPNAASGFFTALMFGLDGVYVHGVYIPVTDRETGGMATFEKHYSAQQLAEMWGLSDKTIRELFRNEPGVIALGKGTHKSGRAYVRRYFSLRIPESVAIRVHDRLMGRP